jgi:hypothetical protein
MNWYSMKIVSIPAHPMCLRKTDTASTPIIGFPDSLNLTMQNATWREINRGSLISTEANHQPLEISQGRGRGV